MGEPCAHRPRKRSPFNFAPSPQHAPRAREELRRAAREGLRDLLAGCELAPPPDRPIDTAALRWWLENAHAQLPVPDEAGALEAYGLMRGHREVVGADVYGLVYYASPIACALVASGAPVPPNRVGLEHFVVRLEVAREVAHALLSVARWQLRQMRAETEQAARTPTSETQ